MLKKWNVLQKDKEYDTPIFSLFRKRVSSPDQLREGNFYTLETGDWVNVIAITKDQKVILVSQYRHGVDDISLEIPGGCIDQADNDPIIAAQRELLEETGYTSKQWQYLGKSSANPAILSNYCHFFCATECDQTSDTDHDHFEEIEISLLDTPLFLNEVKNGTIHHSLTVAAVAYWLLQNKF